MPATWEALLLLKRPDSFAVTVIQMPRPTEPYADTRWQLRLLATGRTGHRLFLALPKVALGVPD